MCKANGSHPTGSCLSQSLGAGEHSGAGGDDIVHQQDAFAGDLLFIQNAIDALQIGAPLCCAQGVLGGGVSKQGENLLRPIREHMDRFCFDRFSQNRTEVRIAELGNDAGVIGAALIGLQA